MTILYKNLHTFYSFLYDFYQTLQSVSNQRYRSVSAYWENEYFGKFRLRLLSKLQQDVLLQNWDPASVIVGDRGPAAEVGPQFSVLSRISKRFSSPWVSFVYVNPTTPRVFLDCTGRSWQCRLLGSFSLFQSNYSTCFSRLHRPKLAVPSPWVFFFISIQLLSVFFSIAQAEVGSAVSMGLFLCFNPTSERVFLDCTGRSWQCSSNWIWDAKTLQFQRQLRLVLWIQRWTHSPSRSLPRGTYVRDCFLLFFSTKVFLEQSQCVYEFRWSTGYVIWWRFPMNTRDMSTDWRPTKVFLKPTGSGGPTGWTRVFLQVNFQLEFLNMTSFTVRACRPLSPPSLASHIICAQYPGGCG